MVSSSMNNPINGPVILEDTLWKFELKRNFNKKTDENYTKTDENYSVTKKNKNIKSKTHFNY